MIEYIPIDYIPHGIQRLTSLPLVTKDHSEFNYADFMVMVKRIRRFMEHHPELMYNLKHIRENSNPNFFRSDVRDSLRIDVCMLERGAETRINRVNAISYSSNYMIETEVVQLYTLKITLYNSDYVIDFQFNEGWILKELLADGDIRKGDSSIGEEFMEFLMDYTNLQDYIDV